MPVIGTFKADKDGYAGTIRTLTMTAKVSILANDRKESEGAPDFRIMAGAAEIGAGDHDAVRMRVIVEAHVIRFGKRRLHGVVAGGAIGRVPIRNGGTGADGQHAAFFRQARVGQHLAGLLFLRVNLSLPALGENAAVLDRHRAIRLRRRLRAEERAGT